MATRAVVTVAVEYVGHDTGLWCLDCMLSTGARVWFTTTMGGGGDGSTALRSSVFCVDCGHRNVVD